MNRADHERLLTEILSDERLESLRPAALERTLALASRQRRRRRRLRTAAIGAMAIVAGVLAVRNVDHVMTSPGYSTRTPTSVAAHPSVASAPSTGLGKVEVITDQQLLALFPGRSAALVGPPGGPRRLLLERDGAAVLQ